MTAQRRVWIDTDPAVTSGNGEVDDAFALIQAMRSPELDIIGISSVCGNAGGAHAYAMAQEIVTRAGRRDIAVYQGCSGPGDRSDGADAILALSSALAQAPLTILALGPLSTIAEVLIAAPELVAQIEEIVFVGGRRSGLKFLAAPDQEKPFRDFNFEVDVAATQVVLASGCALTLAGWETSRAMWLTPADLDALATSGDPCNAWLAKSARPWMKRWQEGLATPGFTPFDTLAVGWLFAPHLFATETCNAAIDTSELVPQLVATPGEGAITYLRDVDNGAFAQNLMARLMTF